MQISLNWINELINIQTVDLEKLITKLTLGGFEVEEILEIELNKKKTITLDISATANRSDSLSISGLALEIGTLLNQIPEFSKYRTKKLLWSEKIKLNVQPILLDIPCSDFMSLTLQNFTNLISPKWLQQKLLASGINPENSLIDYQNYLLLETGYPFEFYDLDKISNKLSTSEFNLYLTSNHNCEHIVASNGLTYKLDNSILMLKANDLPLSIAGIISSIDVACSKETTALVIEGSIFNAAKIRQQSKRLGLRTNRSARYEKSIKSTNLFESFYRLISLLRLTNPNLTWKLHTIAYCKDPDLSPIKVNYQNIKKILGPITNGKTKQLDYISPKTITEYLNRLQFESEYDKQSTTWKVLIPPLRSDDIINEIDVIEEIGRLYGFNNFLTRLPNIYQIGKEDFSYQSRKKITSCLLNFGLNELIQYSLVQNSSSSKSQISLINPLSHEYSNLRTSLLPSLIKTTEENIKKSNPILEGFEYGHIFYKNTSGYFEEKEVLSGIFGGIESKTTWSEPSQTFTWFEAKGKIDNLFKQLNLLVYWTLSHSKKYNKCLHSYRIADLVFSTGEKLGVFGQIDPILAKKLNLPFDLYLFELDFELIQTKMQQNKLVICRDYVPYPKIVKDLSFIIPNKIYFDQIKEILYLNGSKFLAHINILDDYRGGSIPDRHKSLCLQLIFQSNKKTLENKKIEIILDNLKALLTIKFNAIIRS